jgi:hypothetical protein
MSAVIDMEPPRRRPAAQVPVPVAPLPDQDLPTARPKRSVFAGGVWAGSDQRFKGDADGPTVAQLSTWRYKMQLLELLTRPDVGCAHKLRVIDLGAVAGLVSGPNPWAGIPVDPETGVPLCPSRFEQEGKFRVPP